MATDPQSGRYSQPIVNGQSDSSLSSSYGKTSYSSDSVLSSKLSSQQSSFVGSTKSQPNSSSSNASQRFPTSSISDQSRNYSSNQPSSNSSSVNQSSSNSSQSYKSSTDSYKPSDSYKQTSDSYKSQSDSYKSSADSYKSSTDGNKTSSDSYKSSTDSYKSPSDRTNATIGGSSATSAQNYKSDNTPSNTSSSASNAYKPSNLDSSSNKSSNDASQNRAAPPSQNSTSAGQSMRPPENRPVNNYQQSFQNQQRPNTTSSNLQPNSSYQAPSNQTSNAGYQSSNYQQNVQSQRPAQPPAVPQIKRESSNSSISRPSSAFSNQNATNQSLQRPATAASTPAAAAANPPGVQRPYAPNPPLTANQPPRPISPSGPRPPLNQQPGAPRPPSFQTNTSPRPLTPNYQQSTTVPSRVNINQRPSGTNPTLYSNTPNYGVNAPGVRTGPLSATSGSSIYQRGGTTNQPRYSDAGIRPLGTDPRLGSLAGIRPASPLSGYSVDDDKRRMYSSLLSNDLPVDGLSQSALQSGKLKNLINKNMPGEKQTLANEIMKIRQNLVGETIGSYQKRIEIEAAKLPKKSSSNVFSNFIQNDIMKAIRENKKKLEAQKSERNLTKQKSRKNLGEKKKKKKKVKKKKIIKRKKKKPEDSEDGEKKTEGETADDKKPKENGTENDDDEYEEVEIEVSEEEEVTDSECEDDLDDDDDEDDPEPTPDGPASVTNSIKFFEKRDKAKKPVLPKFPVPIPLEKKPKPDSLPVSSEPPEIIRSELIIKSDYKSGVDESPVVHPNLKKVSDVPPKVAKINLDLIHKNRTDHSKSGHTVRYASQPNTPGKTVAKRSKSAANGRASYPGTPTKGKRSVLKQHSSPGTPKKRMPPFNPEEELIRLFNDPKSKFFRRRWDGDHDSGVEENERKDHRPTTNGDIDSPKKTPSKLPAPAKKSMSATSPTKTPLKSPGTAKSLPKTPETPTPPTPLIKKVPMNKIQVGSAPSPNLKAVRSKIGSLANTTHRPGGGHVKIESHKVDFSKAQPRIENKNDTYAPGGGDKKIQQVKLQWQAKPKVGSLDNASYKPKGGEKKIESVKLDFKDKAKPKVGSKENVKHAPGGGTVKSSPSPKEGKSPNTLIAMRWAMVRKTYSRMPPIESQKLEFRAQSKIGSLDNVKHKPGGGDVKIFDDKTYLKQISAGNSEGRASGTQSPMHTSVSKSFSETSQDES